jgi:SAM-dependent methyltransferase
MDAAQYDKQVDWEKRLANEWPFYRDVFRRHDVSSVLDCACGTGRHAIRFAESGLDVTGIDIDPAMIGRARANAAAAGVGVRFETAAFSEVAGVLTGRTFDAVICVGNSLSQLPDLGAVEDAVRNFAVVCRPGGVAVLHVLNYHALMEKEIVPRPLRVSGEHGEPEFFQKIFIPRPPWVHVLMVRIVDEGGKWSSSVSMGKLLPVGAADLERFATGAGFTGVEMRGDYSGRVFDRESSQDLILTAVRT